MLLNRFDLYRAIRNELSQHPRIYSAFASRKGAEPLSIDTDLVIEGYPRSANSYIEAYLKTLSESTLSLAHHSHSRSVVMRAVDLRKPVLVLVRDPIDASVSYLEESGKLSSPWVLFREYSIFYKGLERWADNLLFCSFETATGKPERIVPALNEKFGMTIRLRPPTNEDSSKITELMLRMSEKRANIVPAYLAERTTDGAAERQRQRTEFRAHLLDRRYRRARAHAQSCYDTLSRLAI